jgi:hypothetical protein
MIPVVCKNCGRFLMYVETEELKRKVLETHPKNCPKPFEELHKEKEKEKEVAKEKAKKEQTSLFDFGK